MPSFGSSMSFIYDNVPSEDYGLCIGGFDAPTIIESMASTNTELVYDRPASSDRGDNLIFGTKISESLLTFELELFSYEALSRDDIAYIDNWLFSNRTPKKLVFCQEDMTSYYFMAIFSKNEIISHSNSPMGFKCTVTCDSAYAYEIERENTWQVTNGNSAVIRFNNLNGGLGFLYPKIEFVCNTNNGKLTITNKTENRTFEISGLQNGEKITIDEWFQIKSSTGLNRLANCNKQWLRFVRGINYINVSGNTHNVKIKYRFKKAIGS